MTKVKIITQNNVKNNLTEVEEGSVLDARQGPILKGSIVQLGADLNQSTAYLEFKKANSDNFLVQLNILDLSKFIENKYISDISGKITSGGFGNAAISGMQYVKPNTAYIFNQASYFYSVNEYKKDGTWIRNNTTTLINSGRKFTTSANACYVIITWINVGTAVEGFFNAILSAVQMNEGSTLYPYATPGSILLKEDIINESEIIKYLQKNKAEYKTVIGKNLFDKSKIINGYYVGSTPGTLNTNISSAISPLIPIIAGQTYYIRREGYIDAPEVRFVSSDGIIPLKPINPSTGLAYSDYTVFFGSGAVKAPDTAAYLQFTVKFPSRSYNYDTIQVEIGASFTGFEAYYERQIIDYPNLPINLINLPARVTALENNSQVETINIANSNKIGFFSNSFLNGYCMYGKHALNNLSMWSDHIVYNFGHSGDDMLECLARIDKNETWLGSVPVRQWGITYGVIAMQDNDGALFAANKETYYENTNKVAEAIKSIGGIPILGTEHDSSNYYYELQRLSNEKGYLFMNWGKTATSLFRSVFPPLWYNSHPSTRTAWLWTYGMKKYLDTLPRLRKGLKMFRVRTGIDISNLQNLIYEDNYQRAERFSELTCGVSTLTSSTEKYFDRLDVTGKVFEDIQDEYQKIQAKTSVNFGDYALLEVITPYDSIGISALTVNLVSAGITNVYVKKTTGLTNPLPATSAIAFGVTAGDDLLTVGSTFTVSGITRGDGTSLNKSYVVGKVINGMVVTTTKSSGYVTSGTDTPVCDIAGVTLLASYNYPDAGYLDRYDKPLGEWVEVTMTDGKINLDSKFNSFMMYDKISLLLKGTSIAITDIQCAVSGKGEKMPTQMQLVNYKFGTLMLANTLLDDGTAWVDISSKTKYTPVIATGSGATEALPRGITTVRELSAGQTLVQSLIIPSQDDYELTKMQIRVDARYFPTYVSNDTIWANSEVVRDSYDCSKMSILIDGVKVAETAVGAYWNRFIFDAHYISGTTLTVQCYEKKLQVARVECVAIS